jgi:hypothetical protein
MPVTERMVAGCRKDVHKSHKDTKTRKTSCFRVFVSSCVIYVRLPNFLFINATCFLLLPVQTFSA